MYLLNDPMFILIIYANLRRRWTSPLRGGKPTYVGKLYSGVMGAGGAPIYVG